MTTVTVPVAVPVRRHHEAGFTLIEVLVVLVIVGVMASVIGLSVSGGSRSPGAPEREATLLAVRLERAANGAMAQGLPAAFVWDDEGYTFASLRNGAWAPHPDGVLAAPHKVATQIDMSVQGQRQGAYLIRADLLPSSVSVETGAPVTLDIAFRSFGGDWEVVFDGHAAHPRAVTGPER